MLKISATNPHSELTREAKQLITDAVFRAYKRYRGSPYTWETYWKVTKQTHFNLWIWLMTHHNHTQNYLKEDTQLLWYFDLLATFSTQNVLGRSKIDAKILKFDFSHPDIQPDNPEFFTLTF